MVARVTTGVTQSPGAMAIRAGSSKEAAYHLAYNMGKELRHLGFNFNFAPEGDVNNNPLNPEFSSLEYPLIGFPSESEYTPITYSQVPPDIS